MRSDKANTSWIVDPRHLANADPAVHQRRGHQKRDAELRLDHLRGTSLARLRTRADPCKFGDSR